MTLAPLRLTSECLLVHGTARHVPDDARLAMLAQEPLDWGRVLVIAEGERAMTALFRTLTRVGPGSAPPEAMEHLRRSAMVRRFRMLHLAKRLAATVDVLRDRGIPVMLLKGAALGAGADGDLTRRPMTDLDLLVRAEDAARARDAVIDAGWPETQDPALHAMLQDGHHLPPFDDPGATGLRLELHTHLLPRDEPFGLSLDEWWAGATRLEAGPYRGAWLPSPSHLLLHACVHFAWAHAMRFGVWRAVHDVSALLEGGSIDHAGFVALARRTRAQSACYWTLRLASHLGDIAVAPPLLEALAPPTSERVRRALERHLIAAVTPGEGVSCPSLRLTHWLWRLAIRPGWSGHAPDRRWATSERWAVARGRESTETRWQRLRRHLRGARHWWRFATRTLRGRPIPR